MLTNLPKNLEPDILVQSASFFPRVFHNFTYHSKYLSAYYYNLPGPSSLIRSLYCDVLSIGLSTIYV